jgi:hypothetical protein
MKSINWANKLNRTARASKFITEAFLDNENISAAPRMQNFFPLALELMLISVS